MSECRQPISGRLPPHVEGPAGRFADRLRSEPIDLDDVTRARVERSVLRGWESLAARGARSKASVVRRKVSPSRSRLAYAALVATAAAAGGFLVVLVSTPSPVVISEGSGQFELHLPDGAIQRGPVAEGQTLESGHQSQIQINVGHSRIEMERDSRLRLDRLTATDLEMTLSKGRVDIAFDPRAHGEEQLVVQTRAARVRVVGTRFAVDVDGQGNTRVRVSEGVVEVQPRYGGDAHAVGAGEDLEVMADSGDNSERAVRETLMQNLSRVDAQSTSAAGEPVAQAADSELLALAGEPLLERQVSEPHRVNKSLDLATVHVRALGADADGALEAARELLRAGRHASARRQLRKLAKDTLFKPGQRSEAWMLLAESYTAQGYVPRATAAYRSAARVAPDEAVGHNAVFALGRLLERYTRDQTAAVAAYEDYLQRVPEGALAAQARHALCRLGGYPEYCDRGF